MGQRRNAARNDSRHSYDRAWAAPYRRRTRQSTNRERGIPNDYTPRERNVWSLQEAREILNRLIGDNLDWVPLDSYLAEYLATPEQRTTAMASTFASSLELVRQGQVELRQSLAFGPLLVRRRKSDGPQTGN